MAPTQGAARFKEMDRISAMVKQLEETEKLAAKMRMDMSNSTK
jgi:5-enolpyruvylshikimate-3-phosphate synthase